MRAVLVAGARPQFIKAAALLPALRARGETLFFDTGQHWSAGMVDAHFAGLDLPRPDVRLDVRDPDRTSRVAKMTDGIAAFVGSHEPDVVVVMGDTDSAVAGARAAARKGVRLAHVEAGARSGERDLPEEINRIEIDEVSQLLFCSTKAHAENLAGRDGVHVVGDVMADVLAARRARILALADPASSSAVPPSPYGVLTLHRAATADDPAAVARVLGAAGRAGVPVVFPRHPRTRLGEVPPGVEVRDPMPYLEFLGLVAGARFVLTDSGGLQKEACLLGVPCITLREATEWGETLAAGCNVLVGTDPDRILDAMRSPPGGAAAAGLYGDGRAAQRIAAICSAP